ncbi:MAG: hypothetical protein ACLP62_11450 [Acidimicrobiales bacterium]
MTSSVDTAELPRVRPVAVGPLPAPATTPLRPVAPAPPAAAVDSVKPEVVMGRSELRAERRAARRLRRRYAALGIGVLAASLAVTVAVLDVIR